MSLGLARLRTAGAALACGLFMMFALTPTSNAATAEDTPPFVELHGTGAWSVNGALVSWQNDLAGAKAAVDLNYVKHGTLIGRQDVVNGDADFVISGVPFTQAELKNVKGRAESFVSAPVQVATLATFVEPPTGGFATITARCDPDDETTWPPDVTDGSVQCIVKAPYSGPIRIPHRNLGAMYLHYFGSPFSPLFAWNHADVKSAFGVQAIATAAAAGPSFAGRSDPDEISFYWQTYVKTAAPDVWDGNRQLNPDIPWEPVTERVGKVAGVTRDGAEQQLAQLNQGGCGVLGTCSNDVAGGVAPAPPSMLKGFNAAFPKQPIELAQMQNANGDWVGPTPDAINKAVDAGGATPLYALTNKVPGAYPLVWVDRLYAPAKGLNAAKTEGLAMTIRYLATSGQKYSTAAGEGRLSQALIAEALAAADALVRSNCQGADRRIVANADPGPLAPASATEMQQIGSMLHCESVVAGTTTTTITPATRVPFVDNLPPVDNTPVDTATGSEIGSGSATGSESTPSPANSPSARVVEKEPQVKPRSVLLTASRLPLPMPLGAAGPDRLAAFLLGAFLFLVLRKPLTRAAKRLAI